MPKSNNHNPTMSRQYNLYKSVTADISQVCDGRTFETFSQFRDESHLDRTSSSNNLCVMSHTVSCNDDNCEAKVLSYVFEPYLPLSRKTKAKDEGKLLTDDSNKTREPSPDNVISMLADTFANHSRQPPAMPFDSRGAVSSDDSSKETFKPCTDATKSSRSMSMPPMSDLEMWKTGQSHLLAPPIKQLKNQSTTSDTTHSPLTPDRSKTIPESNGYQTPPSKLLLRKKSTPQHRSPHSLSCIMKIPKYSPGVVSFLHSDLDGAPETKSTCSAHGRSNSMPPLGPLPDVFDYSRRNSIASLTSLESNDDGWLPKGVDFKSSVEVYVFKSHQG